MSTTVADNTGSTILSCAITRTVAMSPAAKELLEWKFDAEDQARMAELAAKARAGSLTDDEQVELNVFELATSLLGIVKSKARQHPETSPNGAR